MEPLQYEERGYLKEPFRLFHLADGRGEYIEYHYHAFHKIIILLAGKAGYAVEGERYELSPGDFVLVGRGSIHRPVVAAGDYYERMILYIAPEYLRSLTAGDCDPSECFRRAQETFQYVYRDENGSRVRPLFQALAETIRQGGYGAALLAQAQAFPCASSDIRSGRVPRSRWEEVLPPNVIQIVKDNGLYTCDADKNG